MDTHREDIHFEPEEFADYFEGRMTEEEAEHLERHLGLCDECRDAAEEPSRRALARHLWTAASHRVAVDATTETEVIEKAPVLAIGTTRSHWRAVAAASAIAATSAAATILLTLNIRDRELTHHAKRIAELESQISSDTQRIFQLSAELNDLRSRTLPTSPRPDSGPPRPPKPIEIAEVEPLSMQARDLGTEKRGESRSLVTGVRTYRLPLNLPTGITEPEVDVSIGMGSVHIQRRVSVHTAGEFRQAILELTAEQIRPFIGQGATVTVEVPGRAALSQIVTFHWR